MLARILAAFLVACPLSRHQPKLTITEVPVNSFTCPRCQRVSHNRNDAENSYCEACNSAGPNHNVNSPEIEGKRLDESDIGRLIIYKDPYGSDEIGVLSSFREDGTIFVRFKGPNGENSPPDRLHWVSPADLRLKS